MTITPLQIEPTAVTAAPAEPETILELRGITKTYGSVTALEGVDLAIKRGEVIALLRSSGPGTTLVITVPLP